MWRVLAVLVASGLIVGAQAAEPPRRGPFCAARGALLDKLRRDYQQEAAGKGQVGPDRLMEILIGRDGGWTVLMTEANGVSCIVAAGENWDSRNLVFAQGA
ncbi:hypothetical protein BL470_005329 [Escherichia coli]|nr:hypothetical protein [Salmonella enterica subsp. enterica serovar Newport]ECI7685783.1 hypothetical protein [Salmonella enterica subsp. enterica serovar Paratyphi A]EFG8200253.1 hypothetical protein [Escherichia coli]EFG9941236.1 hypothetical protein [Escherichia coli]